MFEVHLRRVCVMRTEREAEKADGDERVARAGAPQHTSRGRYVVVGRGNVKESKLHPIVVGNMKRWLSLNNTTYDERNDWYYRLLLGLNHLKGKTFYI